MNAQREADEAAIRGLVGRIIEGLQNRDPESLRELYAEDIVSFDVEPPLQHVGIEAKLKNWAPVFQFFATVRYEIRDLEVVVGGDVAFGYGFGRLSGTLKDGSAVGGMWVRVTYCLTRTGGAWRVAHDQVSVPLDIATGKALTDLQP
jgi:ketosteroid isomerase-like protein